MAKKVQVIVRIYETADQSDYIIPCEMTVKEAIELIAKIAFPAGHPAHGRLGRFTLMDADRQVICNSRRILHHRKRLKLQGKIKKKNHLQIFLAKLLYISTENLKIRQENLENNENISINN
jgi:hypothetical protein